MADRACFVNSGPDGAMNTPVNQWTKVKLVDNGDETHSIAVRDTGSAPSNGFKNIAGAGTTVVKSGAGRLVRIVYNKPLSSSVVTLFDSLTAAGTKIATLANPLVLLQQQNSIEFDLNFSNGLTVSTSAADDITVIFR